MDKRNFEEWLKTFTDSVATWGYYTDFEKVYKHVNELKIELNILNSLIGSNNIEQDFRNIVSKYPETLKCIPILLAKREAEILIRTSEKEYNFNFRKMNYSVDEYVEFMDRNGLFDLLKNHLVNNLVDYLTGVEVGLDSNARKNRTGHTMENLVEQYIIQAGFIKNSTYFKEMYKTDIEKKWGY